MMFKKTHRLIRPLLAVFVGASTTLAFAPYAFWPMAIISPALLFLLLNNVSARTSALIGFCWGFGQFATGISWVQISIDNFGGMPKIATLFLMFLLVSYLAIYPMLFAGLLNRYFPNTLSPPTDRIRFFIVIPVFWLLADLARGWVMTGFPWLLLGYSQIDSPLASFAPIGGVQLITLGVVLIASSIAYAINVKRPHSLLLALAIFAGGFSFNSIDWVTVKSDDSPRFALIQGNIDQALKWLPNQRWPTLMKYLDLSRENWDADIIIWPEAAIPALEQEVTSFLTNVDSAARNNDSALITGVITKNNQGNFYNSIITLGRSQSDEYNVATHPHYNKHHLLPFGEFVPFESLLRPLAPFFNLPMSSFTRGELIQDNILAKGYAFAPALCYEIIFGEQVRKNVTENTDFILTLSNDAWFGDSIGPLQHMEIARMRALELGKPLIRATNNGVTAITDYKGKIVAQIPQFKTEVLKAQVSSTTGTTPFYVAGNWPTHLLIMLGLLFAIFEVTRRKSKG